MSLGAGGDDRPYYYRLRGRTLGPFGLQQMRQKAASAQLNNRTDVSRDGLDWAKGGDYPEIFVQEPGLVGMGGGDITPDRGLWYYAVGGAQQGPVDLSVLQQYVASGSIQPSDVVFREGMTDWIPVQSVPELAMMTRATSPPSGAGPTSGPAPGVGAAGAPPESNGMAIAGFVCSLLGCLTCLPALLGLIFSLVALSGKNQANRGLAIAGAIISGIWLVLWVLYVIFIIFISVANAVLIV
jgi:hypothetical protein